MTRGSFSVTAPHICGAEIAVQISWQSWPGTRLDPPEYDEGWSYPECEGDHCPKCGVRLDWDDIFQATVQTRASEVWDRGDETPDDYGEPEDYEDR